MLTRVLVTALDFLLLNLKKNNNKIKNSKKIVVSIGLEFKSC